MKKTSENPTQMEVRSYRSLNMSDEKRQNLDGLEPASFIGLGYDVIHSAYADSREVKFSYILDERYLENNKRKSKRSQDNAFTIIKESLYELYKEFNVQIGVGISYLPFSGRVSAEYSKTDKMTENTYFIKSTGSYESYSEALNEPAEAKEHLNGDFKKNLNGTMSPAELFKIYGTHLIVEHIMGARYDFNYTYGAESKESISDVKVKVDLAYNYISSDLKLEKKEEVREFFSRSDCSSMTEGGKSIPLNPTNQFEDFIKYFPTWLKSTEDDSCAAFIGFSNSSSLTPVWELADSPDRQSELQKEFDEQAAKQQKILEEMKSYIKAIQILSAGSAEGARSQLQAGFIPIYKDLNKGSRGNYIYLAYETTINEDEALTDIQATFNSFKDTILETYYHKNENDLNKNVGGDCIYLWTSADKSRGGPLRSIDVFYNIGEPPEGYVWVCRDMTNNRAELNDRAGGANIYMAIKHG